MKENKKLWWQPAVRIFLKTSGWIAGPIIVSLFLGKFLDKKYNTEPWFFLGLTSLSFLISIFGIIKILSNYIKEIEDKNK
jgi:F0F1-type ATP synthase assembly protein I